MVSVCDKRYHIYNRFRHFLGGDLEIVELSIGVGVGYGALFGH